MIKYILILSLSTIICCKKVDYSDNQKNTVRNSTKKGEHFSPDLKKQFEGTWEKETEYQTNQIKIYFEPGKKEKLHL